jgi:adenylate cyclase
VLEGSVRKAGKRVRVTAQLIDATTGHHLWADRYDRDLDDIFTVQDEITRNIIGSIAPGIVTAEISRAQHKDAARLDAWDCTMRANWHIRRFTREDSIEAIRPLEQALRRDPTSAPALADLALAHHFQAVFGWSQSAARSHEASGEAARGAVSADDQDASAHTALAIHDLFSGRHEEAERRLKRAIDLHSEPGVCARLSRRGPFVRRRLRRGDART